MGCLATFKEEQSACGGSGWVLYQSEKERQWLMVILGHGKWSAGRTDRSAGSQPGELAGMASALGDPMQRRGHRHGRSGQLSGRSS